MQDPLSVDVLILGAGTAGSNAARSAKAAGAQQVLLVHPTHLINTCVEAGCMPSKSILAGAHQHEDMEHIMHIRDTHITRLRSALLEGFAEDSLQCLTGHAYFVTTNEVHIQTDTGTIHVKASAIVIATGSTPFIPSIPGLDPTHQRILVSDDVVSNQRTFTEVPGRILTIGGGPIGLELSTFFHDMGSQVVVLQRGSLLRAFDPEFGAERVRAATDEHSFPIHCDAELKNVNLTDDGAFCTIEQNGVTREETYDYILVATGRRPQTDELQVAAAEIACDERGTIIHNEHLQSSQPHIYVAGDVTGHHQILHYAAAMGKVAGTNAANPKSLQTVDYDRLMLAVSFDQFPSALIGLTETEAQKRGLETITATRHFNSIGLGILKRQEYGLWKLVAEKNTGKIIGSQIVGPPEAGELIQIVTPIIANENTAATVAHMVWYHPTYAEILQSLARDIASKITT